jgi:hypothetical protein
MEPEASFLYSQEPVTGPHPQSDEFSPHSDTLFNIHFQIILKRTPRAR